MRSRILEVQIGEAVVHWLADQRFDIYQEVQAHRTGKIADVVGRVGNRFAVVECKTSFGLPVLAQALNWRDQAHWSYVASPEPRGRYAVARLICQSLGIGWLVYGGARVEELVRPALNRNPWLEWTACLSEQHKTHALAGSQSGGRYTPFRGTVEALEEFVKENPGCTLKAAIDGIKHHYGCAATARSCIAHWIRSGVISTVEWREVAGTQRRVLWLTPAPSSAREAVHA